MMQSDTTHYAIKYWAIFLTVFSFSSYAGSYLCEAEHASGFVYDKGKNMWEAASFPVENKQYLVSPARADDIVSKALKYDYRIEERVSAKPIINCKSIKSADSNEETGLILCRGSFGASFNFDTRSGKYIRSQLTGYVIDATGSPSEKLPYIEIGNCSPRM